ncbi:hypothetical protein [Micromonospora aurantiaca (nom. illeg.)]|uniref:hypothetical protein n=1 Tax=Micromonospora aurantiaca (nom. illeg.) TaxID=47850 RepID=UPI0033DB0642
MAENTKSELRVYRTVDGELVRENDPRGAYLAYGVGDPVADGELDAYRALVAGDTSGHEVPGLMHDRLATQIADAQRVIANAPGSPAADAATERIDAAAELVDAASIPPPPGRDHTSPVAIVREHAAGQTDDRDVAAVRVMRTGDGQLVAEDHPDAAEVAYVEGDRVANADRDAYREVAGDAADQPAKRGRRAANKAAGKPADKAAEKPTDK